MCEKKLVSAVWVLSLSLCLISILTDNMRENDMIVAKQKKTLPKKRHIALLGGTQYGMVPYHTILV